MATEASPGPNADPATALDFGAFHRDALPDLLAAGNGALAARAARGCPPLALRVGDASFTYRAEGDTLRVAPGDREAETVLVLEPAAFAGLVAELEAPAGLLYGGRVRCARGRAIRLMEWEAALRAAYNGIPAYDPARVDLRDGRGAPLDPERTFTLADDRAEMAHFLRTAGYLFVRRVLAPGEVDRLSAELVPLVAEARPGDGLSWWGRDRLGQEVLCRVTRAASRPGFGALPRDPRFLTLAALADESLVHRKGEGDGVAVIFKHPGMTEGLGDLPWHRDCGMGGHAAICPTLIASLYLTEATPETGELAMLPGSRHATFNAHTTPPAALRPARFRAAAGDVSLHFSDTVHAAPPPSRADLDAYRVSAILGFGRPEAGHHRGESSYNAALHQRADGQIEHLDVVARRVR